MEWLILLAAIAVVVPAAAWLGQDRLVFFPQTIGSTAHLPTGVEPLEIVAADGTRLRGWIRPADVAPAPALIYFGGNAEEVSWTLADRRWPRGVAVVAVNYRGYGTSEGEPGEAALVADAPLIFDAIAARPEVDPQRIVVMGRSLGTGVAVKLAARRPLAGVILVSPYDSLVEIGRMHYPYLPVSWLLRHRFDVKEDASRVHAPLLAIVGESDSIIPPARSRALYDAWAGPKTWIALPADHNGLGGAQPYWSAIAEFLAARRRDGGP